MPKRTTTGFWEANTYDVADFALRFLLLGFLTTLCMFTAGARFALHAAAGARRAGQRGAL